MLPLDIYSLGGVDKEELDQYQLVERKLERVRQLIQQQREALKELKGWLFI